MLFILFSTYSACILNYCVYRALKFLLVLCAVVTSAVLFKTKGVTFDSDVKFSSFCAMMLKKNRLGARIPSETTKMAPFFTFFMFLYSPEMNFVVY